MNIKTISYPSEPAEFIAKSILERLEAGKKVLWLVPGGSAIFTAKNAADIISEHPHQNLTVTLTDERYGEVGHKDSNWQQAKDAGFFEKLKDAKFLPVLTGVDMDTTTNNFKFLLETELTEADYRIGLFGIGADGHTSGILPNSGAVDSADLAYNYQAGPFERITTTAVALMKLDEAIIFAKGVEKWKVIEDLKKDIDIIKQPAQILKKVPKLTIFYEN